MKLETLDESRRVALDKWREYRNAIKKSSDPQYKDLARVYNQLKNGQKVIDIFKVIQKGGLHYNFHPKLAIAKATEKTITCQYYKSGRVVYAHNHQSWGWKALVADVDLPGCFTQIPAGIIKDSWQDQLRLQAPVPIIPPKALPNKLTEDYYILWEVDEWKLVPPTDPWLLKRITKTLFVVLAGWDLTELEKAVMAGRMR